MQSGFLTPWSWSGIFMQYSSVVGFYLQDCHSCSIQASLFSSAVNLFISLHTAGTLLSENFLLASNWIFTLSWLVILVLAHPRLSTGHFPCSITLSILHRWLSTYVIAFIHLFTLILLNSNWAHVKVFQSSADVKFSTFTDWFCCYFLCSSPLR